jgi:saccharopine dehydrogenase-like NADP-dependent oxidoreductase
MGDRKDEEEKMITRSRDGNGCSAFVSELRDGRRFIIFLLIMSYVHVAACFNVGATQTKKGTSTVKPGFLPFLARPEGPSFSSNFFIAACSVRSRSHITRILPLRASSQGSINNSSQGNLISFEDIIGKNFLVVGGSGRVGGSVVVQLLKRGAAKVTVGGTSIQSFDKSLERWKSIYPDVFPTKASIEFQQVNREDHSSVSKVVKGNTYDLVIHTAGPFQGKVKAPNGVLKACVEDCGVPYIDVCDDYCTAMAAKSKFASTAEASSVPCIVSTGCWPGVSSLMAKQVASLLLNQYPQYTAKDLSLKYCFFTAGSGGAGSTLLVATFLILAEQALTIQNGRRVEVPAMKEYDRVNFGSIVGDKDVAHLNLLETASIFDTFGIANIDTKFGTAPGFWNTLLGVMAQLPSELLANEPLMTNLALFSLPLVRLVDYFAGATNAMRCEIHVTEEPAINAMALYAHENLEPCVGECVVAFAAALLAGSVPPGVWFPEEAIAGGSDAAAVLNLASVGAHTVEARGSFDILNTQLWGSRNTNTIATNDQTAVNVTT